MPGRSLEAAFPSSSGVCLLAWLEHLGQLILLLLLQASPSKEWSNVQIKSNSALRGCKMLEPSKERREITSRDRVFAKTSRDARRDLREIEKWIRSPPPGALHFYGRANAIHFSTRKKRIDARRVHALATTQNAFSDSNGAT